MDFYISFLQIYKIKMRNDNSLTKKYSPVSQQNCISEKIYVNLYWLQRYAKFLPYQIKKEK